MTLPQEYHWHTCRGVFEVWPIPSDFKSLCSFLGLASYYHCFIPQFSSVADPLHAPTHKDASFEWTAECKNSFQTLKQLLTNTPILCFLDFPPTWNQYLGAVLAQQQDDETVHPLAYMYTSCSLQQHEKNYWVTEPQALGVVWVVKDFRNYTYGHHVDVFTDHQALQALLTIHYRAGKNANASGLFKVLLQIGIVSANCKTLRVIPSHDRKSLFDQAHSEVFGAHLKKTKIHSALSCHYWWPGYESSHNEVV